MKNKESEPKKKVSAKVLVAKLVMFTVVVVWTFGWLTAGLSLVPFIFPGVWEGDIATAHPMEVFMLIWWVTTFIVVGVWAAVKGFRFVGKWEKE